MADRDEQQKIASLLTDEQGVAHIRDKYEEIYRNSDVWLYKKSHGVHSVIYSMIKDQLSGRRLLDVGCGAGRLAIMAALAGAEVDGFDFSEAAIAIARLNAACAGSSVNFFVDDIQSFSQQATQGYDVITLVGVLEHVADPVTTLSELYQLTNPGGTLIVSCPNFINPRGFSYMTLLTLLNLPMSLADLRQVDYISMAEWCKASGYSLASAVGAIYRFGWDQPSATDMIKRVPLAVRDAQLGIPIEFESYNAWQQKMTDPSRRVLEWLEAQQVLKRIERGVTISLVRDEQIDEALWQRMCAYMEEDIASDPYYSDVDPFCYMGGECIYMLRRPA